MIRMLSIDLPSLQNCGIAYFEDKQLKDAQTIKFNGKTILGELMKTILGIIKAKQLNVVLIENPMNDYQKANASVIKAICQMYNINCHNIHPKTMSKELLGSGIVKDKKTKTTEWFNKNYKQRDVDQHCIDAIANGVAFINLNPLIFN